MLGYFIEDDENQTLIHPNKVLEALQQFVWDFQAKQRGKVKLKKLQKQQSK